MRTTLAAVSINKPWQLLTRYLPRSSCICALMFAWMNVGLCQAGLKFEFDYSYDTRGFFNDPARKAALEKAGRIVNWYVDELDAIEPLGGNTWSSFFSPPNGANSILLSNLTVPKDTMQIFVAGASIPGRLAQSIDTAPVGFGAPSWIDTVEYRGEAGANINTRPTTDNGPMGGTISFNDDPNEVKWYYDTSITGIGASQFDFITVASHELLHLLGIGIAHSWSDHTNDVGQFIGANALAVGSPTNANLQLDPSEGHWKSGTRSTWNGSLQEALLAPGIFPGRRAFPTALDRAALRDIGWEEASPGDANLDRLFDSTDLLAVFQAGLYETGKLAAWSEGDWNDNGVFESGDLVTALQTGRYELPAPARMVPEPSAACLMLWGLLHLTHGRRRRTT